MFSLATILHHLDVRMNPPNYEMKMAFYGLPAATKRLRLKCERRPPTAGNSWSRRRLPSNPLRANCALGPPPRFRKPRAG